MHSAQKDNLLYLSQLRGKFYDDLDAMAANER